MDRCGILQKHTCSSGLARSAFGFNAGSAFLVPVVLPGLELRHDRVFCTHDLEGLDRPHWQREPHRGGAEVGPTSCTCCPDPEAGLPCGQACMTAQSQYCDWTESSLLIPV